MWKRSLGLTVAVLALTFEAALPSPGLSRAPGSVDTNQSGSNESTLVGSNNSTLPASYTVSQNYPNPFNLETTIEYSLPQQSGVYVTIYNMLGDQVAMLKNDIEDAGYHRIIWAGTDSRGCTVASGIYFFRIVADDFYALRKIIVLK